MGGIKLKMALETDSTTESDDLLNLCFFIHKRKGTPHHDENQIEKIRNNEND